MDNEKRGQSTLRENQLGMFVVLFAIVCIVTCIILKFAPQLVLIMNIIWIIGLLVVSVYSIINHSIRKIVIWVVCSCMGVLIIINQLYSPIKLETLFPGLGRLSVRSANPLAIGIVTIIILGILAIVANVIIALRVRNKAKKENLSDKVDEINEKLQQIWYILISTISLAVILGVVYFELKNETIKSVSMTIRIIVMAFCVLFLVAMCFLTPFALKSIKNDIKEHNVKSIAQYVLSGVLTAFVFFEANHIPALSEDKLIEMLVNVSDGAAVYIGIIAVIVLMVIVYGIIFWIISFVIGIAKYFGGFRNRITKDIGEILKQIHKIGKSIFEIITESISTTLDFVKAIPDFLGELYKLVINENDTVEIRIVKIASFAVAMISWYATAEGLNLYVFSRAWQAALVSFGIQATLFVLNLRLPYYFRKEIKGDRKESVENKDTVQAVEIFGDLKNDTDQTSVEVLDGSVISSALVSQNHELKKANQEIAATKVIPQSQDLEKTEQRGIVKHENHIPKKGLREKVCRYFVERNWKVIIVYFLLLGTSSLFSFIYISNSVYKDTMYTNADVYMGNEYRKYTNEIEKFVYAEREHTILRINYELAQLNEEAQDEKIEDSNKQEIENIIQEYGYGNESIAASRLEELIAEEETKKVKAEEECSSIQNVLDQQETTEFRQDPNNNTSIVGASINKDYLESRKEEEEDKASSAEAIRESYTIKQGLLLSYNNRLEKCVKDMLILLTKSDLSGNKEEIDKQKESLMTAALKNNSDNAGQIISHVQEISLLIDRYIDLNGILENSGENTVEQLGEFIQKNQLNGVEVKTPIYSTYSSKNADETSLNFFEKIIHNTNSVNYIDEVQYEEDVKTWKEMWGKRLEAMENVIGKLPSNTDEDDVVSEGEVATDFSKESNEEMKQTSEFNSSSNEIQDKKMLDQIAHWKRVYLGNINDVERAMVNFKPYGIMSFFALLFAPVIDLVSLAAGVWAYKLEEKTPKDK